MVRNLFQCHFVHHKSHMNWPGVKPGPAWRQRSKQKGGWALEPVWTFWRGQKSLASTRNRMPDTPAHNLVIIPATAIASGVAFRLPRASQTQRHPNSFSTFPHSNAFRRLGVIRVLIDFYAIAGFTLVYTTTIVGHDSSVGISTRYELNSTVRGANPGKEFSAFCETSAVAHPASYTMVPGLFPGGKAVRACI